MKRIVFCSFFFICFLSYGLFLSQFNLSIMPDEIVTKNADGFFDYRGVTSVHSSVNLGSLPPEEVIREAKESKLNFVIFTDLNYFQQSPIQEGYHDRLLVFWAGTYSYLGSHVLLYGKDLEEEALQGLGSAQMYLSERLGSQQDMSSPEFTVLAHPLKGGENWQGPYPPGLYGIETINLKSIWRQAWQKTKASFFWSVFVYPFNDHLALTRLYLEPKNEIALWDDLNRQRKTIGFVGNETTARTIPIGKSWLRFPSYQTSFEIASNHILLNSELTGNPVTDREKILTALKKGQFYLSLDILADPKGFTAYIEDKRKKKYLMGSEIPFSEGLTFKVKLPEKPKVPFEVVIVKDGINFTGSNAKVTESVIPSPGVYRAVVRVIPTFPLPDGKKWISWIYTNPFFISSDSSKKHKSTTNAH